MTADVRLRTIVLAVRDRHPLHRRHRRFHRDAVAFGDDRVVTVTDDRNRRAVDRLALQS